MHLSAFAASTARGSVRGFREDEISFANCTHSHADRKRLEIICGCETALALACAHLCQRSLFWIEHNAFSARFANECQYILESFGIY